MKRQLDFKAFSITVFVAGLVGYLLYVIGDLLFGWSMYEDWVLLMPGSTWPLSFQSFLVGSVWRFLYSVFLAVMIVLPYSLFAQKASINP